MPPFQPNAHSQVDEFDGTGGRRGPRAHWDVSGPDKPFPEPASYLSSADAAAYDAWTAWSHKPASLDYLSPSKEYFSLGKTKAYMGDVNEPGVVQELIAVRMRYWKWWVYPSHG